VIFAAIAALFVSMSMLIFRGIVGPTASDRILAANSFGTNIVVFIVLVGHFRGTVFFLDVALIYVLINFVSTIAFLRYFEFRKVEGQREEP